MSSVLTENPQQDEARAREILSSLTLPPEIERIDVDLKQDSNGNPALYLSFVLSQQIILDKESTPRLSRYMMAVAQQFLSSGIPRFPYVSLDQAA